MTREADELEARERALVDAARALVDCEGLGDDEYLALFEAVSAYEDVP